MAGLAIGPGGNLYLALPAGVYEVTGDGTLRHIIGARWNPKHVLAWNANPAGQGDFIDVARVAFDRGGNLFVAGGGGWGLYERTGKGALRFVEVFRGDGAGFFGSMATDREGNVVAVDNYGIQVLSASGHASTLTADPKELQDALNRALRHLAKPTPPGTDHYFRGGYGIAAAPNGTIYVDQDTDIWSRTSGILAISPTGRVTTIWLSH